VINPDSPRGKEFGFTSDLFDGYLWQIDDSIYFSLILSKKPREGNLKRLMKTILDKGLTVKVPTPLGLMTTILDKYGFEEIEEPFPLGGTVQVWMKKGSLP